MALRSVAATGLGALAAVLATAPAAADTFVPTRFDDPPPGRCKPNDCSLREAARASNAHAGRDTIALDRGRYELEIPVTGPDTGSIDLLDGVVLAGKGPGKTKIDANAIDRVINVGADNDLGDRFAIKGVTITGGVTDSYGGGIQATSFEDDKLELAHVAIRTTAPHSAAASMATCGSWRSPTPRSPATMPKRTGAASAPAPAAPARRRRP